MADSEHLTDGGDGNGSDASLPATEPFVEPTAHTDRQTQPVDTEQPPKLPFIVVGIGASAGGLEAISAFISAVRADSGMAYVFLQHLPPTGDSLMAEILSRRSLIPVIEVAEDQAIEPNHLYVIRPGQTLTLKDGHFHLGHRVDRPMYNRPVDDFFKSLAQEQRERAVGIILSGMGSNGSAGAQAIKAVGGLCIAQDPESAQFDSMPRHLIDTGYADSILRPEDMANALLAYAGHPYASGQREQQLILAKQDQHYLREILAILRSRSRQDFSGYKKPTVLRRIQRRMGLSGLTKIADYTRMLRQSPVEASALADDLLIHVTGFFRDPDAWEALRERVVVPLIASKDTDAPIRCWVTACSSGEEAYSLAMLLVEEAERIGKRLDIKVFATDMADRTLQNARSGLYPGGIESEILPERLNHFFHREDAVYRVRQDLRERVIFAPQNLLLDPPFSRLDIVSCRNLLIYLEPDVQQRVLSLLHFGLREGGTLFLGTSETPSRNDLFEPIDKKARLYRRIGPTRHGASSFPMHHAFSGHVEAGKPRAIPVAQLTSRALLEQHTPAAVTIDHEHQIVYYHGNTDEFLSSPRGEPTRDLLQLVRDTLRSVVRTVIYRASMEQAPVTLLDGWIDIEPGERRRIAVTASPLASEKADHLVVSFRELSEHPVADEIATADDQGAPEELRRVRDELQSTIEELQTANEELKASHEEVVSSNEELQSSNEELETSREEMQSLNEELRTINAQLHVKIEEHLAVSNDLSSLLTSTSIAVLFLDRQFRIRRFTPQVQELFGMIASDVGRPLADLSRKFTDPHLTDDLKAVLDQLAPLEREVSASNARHYVRRVLPYRTSDNRIDGLVITFVDITDRKLAEQALQQGELSLAAELKATNSLHATSVKLAGVADLDSGLHEVLVAVMELLKADFGIVQLLKADDQFLTMVASHGFGPGSESGHIRQFDAVGTATKTTCGRALLKRQQVIVQDMQADPEFKAISHRLPFRGAISTPMIRSDGVIIGMLSGYFKDVHEPNDRELKLTDLFARQAADLIERTQRINAQRHSEERYRALVNATSYVVYRMNPDWSEMWQLDGRGFVSDTQRPSKSWLEQYIPHEDQPQVLATIRQAVKSKSVFEMEHQIRRMDGTFGWTFSRAVPLLDEKGEIIEWFGAATDVTERKQSEETLRDSEAGFRALSDLVPDLLWHVDPRDGSGWTNKRWTEYTGQPDSAVRPWGWLEVIHPDDRDKSRAAALHAHATGTSYRIEQRIRRASDGMYRWFLVRGVPVRDAGGMITRWFGTATDIHDQRAALDALATSEEQARTLIEGLQNHAILLLDADGNIASWNGGAERLTGYSGAEAIGKHMDACLTPEEKIEGVAEEILETARRTGRWSGEIWQVRKNGTRYWASNTITALHDADGAIRGYSRIIRDDSERREAEGARGLLASIVQTSTDAIVSYTLDGRIVSWNPAAERMFGYTAEEAGKMMLSDFMPPEFSDEQKHFTEELRKGPVTQVETIWLTKSQQRIDVSLTAAMVSATGAKPLAAAILQDITQRKRAEESLRASKAAAEEANRLKDEFLATLSHELRTPLGAILLWAKLLQGETLSDKAQLAEGLRAIRTSAEAQKELIEDLLDMSRITTGNLRMQMRDVELVNVLQDALAAIEPAADAKEVTVAADLGTPAVVRVDPDRVRQVLWNLLTNAVKFTPAGGKVSVTLRRSDKEVQIQVTDTGMGIEKEFLPYVFERFRQADASHGRAAGGMGLGLAIVKQLVELHGGTITADSPGLHQGATFIVRLPLPKSARRLYRKARIADPGAGGVKLAAGVSQSVLLIEDDLETRRAVATVLRQVGMKVIEADNAASAMKLFEELSPNLIVSDIGLPGEDGYSLIRRIRQREAGGSANEVPAIALTAFARETDRRIAIEAGFQQHVGKPIEPDELLKVVRELLQNL